MVEEQQLVQKMLAGDRDAEVDFFKLFKPRLLRAAYYFLGWNDSEAEDVVQDTFMVALPKLKDYDFNAPIFAWLRQICLRLCYARLRKRRKVLITAEEDLELHLRRQAVERLQTTELEAQKQWRLEQLAKLRLKLNPDSRQIMELRDVQGHSYAVISQTLSIPMGTVMSRVARAREQLRKLIEIDPDDGLPREA